VVAVSSLFFSTKIRKWGLRFVYPETFLQMPMSTEVTGIAID
jgi:hypothetical protein